MLSKGEQVAFYYSDVSGAFDRVSAYRLLYKLKIVGVHGSLLVILQSWLKRRSASVVVDGAKSTSFY